MNLPNKLTIFRVILIPFFVFFLLTDVLGANGDYLALVIFIVASLTDMLDGKLPESIIWSQTLENLWIRWQISCWCVPL